MTLIVILAGGDGRRIGGDKPQRLLFGESLIDRSIRIARQWSDDVRIALRFPAQLQDLNVPVLLDVPLISGPLAGLACALRAARADGHGHVLTLPCDMPFLPSDLLPRLAVEIGEHGAAVATGGGHVHPVCALWRADAQDLLPAHVASGQRSLRGFAEKVGWVAVDWPDACFANVNTPQDLAAAERRLASEVED